MKRYAACAACAELHDTGVVVARFSTCSPGKQAPTVWEPGDSVRLVSEGGPRTDDKNHCAWHNSRNGGYAMACAVTDKVRS